MYQKDSPETIQAMFNHIANRYDLTNAVLSFSLHKRWNRSLVKHVQHPPSPIYLDLCSGTGDIAFDYLKRIPSSCHAYLIDFSSEMLECAKRKSSKSSLNHHQISFLEADVQKLPLPNQFADCTTMAYGIRNVQNPSRCIQEIFRVLKPGGFFGILELTRPRYRLLRLGHTIYMRTILPLLGKWLTDNRQAYQYLCQSIQSFITPEELESLFSTYGFSQIKRHSLAGGIATILTGSKPFDS